MEAKKKSRRKGVLTMEAAIILPIFITVMVFLLSVMKLFYFHLVMQQAVNNVGRTMAQFGYVIDQVVDINNFSLKPETQKKEDGITGSVNKVIQDGKIMAGAFQDFGIDKLGTIIDTGKQFGTDVKAVGTALKAVKGEDIINYLLVSAMNDVGGDFVKWMIGDYLDSMQSNSSAIQNITYNFYVENGTKDFIFVVEYDYKFDLLIKEPLHFQQIIRIHPWVGGSTKGIYGSVIGG